MRLALLAPMLLLASPALAQDADTDFIILKPDQIGQIFCLSRIGNDEAPIRGLLSPDLTQAIADANAKNDAYLAANPDEKPPLGDGIPWGSWPDYTSHCTVGVPTLMQDEASVAISYDFPEDKSADYTDTLDLSLVLNEDQSAKVWRIDNIHYGEGSDLKTELIGAFSGN
jgi:hypothetical protein